MKKLTIAGIVTALVALVFCSVVGYYYWTTPSTTVVVSSQDSPSGVSPGFTPSALTDHVVTHLRNISSVTDSNRLNDVARQEGLGPQAVRQTVLPIRTLSPAPSPVFGQKVKGVSFDLARELGMTFKARTFLELAVIGAPGNGWQLAAELKKRPEFLPNGAGNAPKAGGSCRDLEMCASDLAEQIERLLDPARSLSFYIKTNTRDANQGILDFYEATSPADALSADDLVAWGNAFYGLGKFDQALQKYQEALAKDGNSCPAHLARGYLYYSEPRRPRLLADLQQAESDFRTAIVCDPKNEISHNNLCMTLLREWTNFPSSGNQRLTEAKQECGKAVEINPQFVLAAVNAGYILYREGKHDEALNYFDDLSQKYPTDSGLFVNYGYLEYLEYLAGNRDALAQAISQTLQSWNLAQDKDKMINRLLVRYAAATNLGFFYYERGDYAEALDFWAKARALNTGDPDCIAGLALGNYKQGDQHAAVNLLSEAIKSDAHYRDPTYLRQNNSWSARASSDLDHIIPLLPVTLEN